MENKEQHNKDFLNLNIGKNGGFSTPKNYFNDLENDLISKMIVEELPEKCGFETPSNYFDNLEETILAKVNEEQKSNVKVISFRKRIIQFTSAAAAAILLLVTFNYTINIGEEETAMVTIDEWFENSDVTTDDLALLLDDEDFSEEVSYEFENNGIEDYLDNIGNSSVLDEIQ
ncbi:hypothetical protein [uncultured Tenacibaculum sp.]|uniref:hypothetical protein n=1 Tax=uncultured Tenacibaculum sp. TaxID=174713 RepID=UPI0026239125|nr:hypothetical protein [uncultured Tenacibaculum sp.]